MTAVTRYHDFATSLARGKIGEDFLDMYYNQIYNITPASRGEQRTGIDRIFQGKEPQRYYVEYKTDYRAHLTGNAFLETASVDTESVNGWTSTSRSTFLLYFVSGLSLIFVMETATIGNIMKARVWNKFPLVSAPNRDYASWGRIVPLWEVARWFPIQYVDYALPRRFHERAILD